MSQPHPALQVMRILALTFVLSPVILAVLAYFIVPETTWPALWVVAVLLGLVAVGVTMVFMLTGSMLSSAPPGTTVEEALPRFRSLQMVSLALLEAPVILALVIAVAVENSWVPVAITAVPATLAMLALAYPHEGTLRRVQRQLDASGTSTRFADRMLGRVN